MQTNVLIDLERPHDGVVGNVCGRLRRRVQPVQFALQVLRVARGGVVPHFPVVHAQKSALHAGGFAFFQIAVPQHDVRIEAILDAHVGIVTLSELQHTYSLSLRPSAGRIIVSYHFFPQKAIKYWLSAVCRSAFYHTTPPRNVNPCGRKKMRSGYFIQKTARRAVRCSLH